MSASGGMRHITVMATNFVSSWLADDATHYAGVLACDWSKVEATAQEFDLPAAVGLLTGTKVELPTCPACAALLDLALEMRGAS